MIIQALSKETNYIAKKTRDLLEASLDEVFFVPFGIKKIVISHNVESDTYTVFSMDEHKLLDESGGYYYLKNCWIYAKTIAAAAGLTEEDIECHVITEGE